MEINKSLDRFFELRSSLNDSPASTCHYGKIWNILSVVSKDPGHRVPYLLKDIDKNIIHNAYREIDTF
ncbi:MAG: hypothetical protein IPI77_24105 [Saprospiraceae bacterium]|nr:hypothetical protein [Saprospiraceae bacterium]